MDAAVMTFVADFGSPSAIGILPAFTQSGAEVLEDLVACVGARSRSRVNWRPAFIMHSNTRSFRLRS